MFDIIKIIATRMALLISGIALTLRLMEFAIRTFYPQPIDYYNFALLQAEGGAQMVLGADISASRERPKGYGPYVPNLSTTFAGIKVNINSRGWRDADHPLARPDGITRIMVLGDSVAFGYGVQLEEMFSRVLERELNQEGPGRYEVITLGGAAGNTYFQKRAVRDNLSIYKPDLVILAFNLNDIVPPEAFKGTDGPSNRWSISRSVLRLRRALDGTLRNRSHMYFLFRERMKGVLRQFGIASPAMVPMAAFDMESNYAASAWRDTSSALLDIAHQLEKEKVKFLVAILPVDIQLSLEVADLYRREYGFVFSDSLVNGKPQEIIMNFAKEHGIACVDLLPAFRENAEEKKFFRIHGGSVDWNHPNALGHKIIGEELEKTVRPRIQTPNGQHETGDESLPPATQRVRLRRGGSRVA